jgi:hypothetical protein
VAQHVFVSLVSWLRAHNTDCPSAARVAFYGLDLYSLHRSIEAVLTYLHQVDPACPLSLRLFRGFRRGSQRSSSSYGSTFPGVGADARAR